MNQSHLHDKAAKDGTKNSMLIDIGKGLLGALALTVAMVVVFVFVMWACRLSDGVITVVNQLIKLVCILFGAWIATRNHSDKGWLRGGMVGTSYVVVTLLAAAIVNKGIRLGLPLWLDLIIGILCGGLGGILAVNLHKPKRQS